MSSSVRDLSPENTSGSGSLLVEEQELSMLETGLEHLELINVLVIPGKILSRFRSSLDLLAFTTGGWSELGEETVACSDSKFLPLRVVTIVGYVLRNMAKLSNSLVATSHASQK